MWPSWRPAAPSLSDYSPDAAARCPRGRWWPPVGQPGTVDCLLTFMSNQSINQSVGRESYGAAGAEVNTNGIKCNHDETHIGGE